MKEKYVEERYSRYFIFGVHPNGAVDVASTSKDTIVTTGPERAKAIVADRDTVIDALVAMAQAFDKADPEAFKNFWYGDIK